MTRMREQLLDVDLVVTRESVARAGGFERSMADLLRQMRHKADERAADVGGEVRGTQNPELIVNEAMHALLGEVFVLGTRWVCDVPEGALTGAER